MVKYEDWLCSPKGNYTEDTREDIMIYDPSMYNGGAPNYWIHCDDAGMHWDGGGFTKENDPNYNAPIIDDLPF